MNLVLGAKKKQLLNGASNIEIHSPVSGTKKLKTELLWAKPSWFRAYGFWPCMFNLNSA